MAIPKAQSPMVQSGLRYAQDAGGVDPNYPRNSQAYQQGTYQNNPRDKAIEEIESQSSSGEGNHENQNANGPPVRIDGGNDERGYNPAYDYANDQGDYKSSSHHTGPSENRRKQVEGLNGRGIYGPPPGVHYQSAGYRPAGLSSNSGMQGNIAYPPQSYPHYPPFQTSPQVSNQRYLQYAVGYNQGGRGYPKPQMPAEDPADYKDDDAQDYYPQEETAPGPGKSYEPAGDKKYDEEYGENQPGSLKQHQQQAGSKGARNAKKKTPAPSSQQTGHHRAGSDVQYAGSQQQFAQNYPNKKSSNSGAYSSSNQHGAKKKKAAGGAGNDTMWGELHVDGYGQDSQGNYGGHYGSSKRTGHDYDSVNTKTLVEASKDWNKQQGSRHLQSLLNNGDSFTINTIIKELTPQLLEVSLNIFGNYVAQKMIEVGTHGLTSEQVEPREHHEGNRCAHERLLLPLLRLSGRAQALRHHRHHRRQPHRRLRQRVRREERGVHDDRPQRQLHHPEGHPSAAELQARLHLRPVQG